MIARNRERESGEEDAVVTAGLLDYITYLSKENFPWPYKRADFISRYNSTKWFNMGQAKIDLESRGLRAGAGASVGYISPPPHLSRHIRQKERRMKTVALRTHCG